MTTMLVVGSSCPKGHVIERPGQVRQRNGVSFCGICAAEYARQYRSSNPDYDFRQKLKKHHLTEDDYLRMLQDQDGRCKICRALPGDRRLSIDHDHACCPGVHSCGQCVRGLLCGGCNRGIGQFKDDPLVLMAAIHYLEEWEASHS